jgi:hypothetical protein
MGKNRVVVQPTITDLMAAKRGLNKDAVIRIGSNAEVYQRTDGRMVIRGVHVKPSHKLGTKAKAMKACAGKKGKEFGSCLTSAGITAPRTLR